MILCLTILGLGSDICDIRRIERALERFGERFFARVFTAVERAHAERRSGTNRTGTYAKRFAAKEACAKALGTGFARGVFMSDLGVVNLPGGQPTLALDGRCCGAPCDAGAATAGMAQIDLTMTDEYPYAYARW